MHYRMLVFITIIFIVSGCAIQGISTFKYTDGLLSQAQVKNETVVSKPYSQVWDALVKELSKSFFVINNIDKESRIINLSFSSSSPANYVDCGKSHRTYKEGENVETFDYEVASSSQYKVATKQQPDPNFSYYQIIRREVNLEGRSNIYIAPDDKNSNNTNVTVNTRYILTIKTRGEQLAKHWNGSIFPLGAIQEDTNNITFNTNQIGQIDIGGSELGKLSCYSKGILEKEILDMTAK